MTRSSPTKTDNEAQGIWCTRDGVIRLRSEGNEQPHKLPDSRSELTIGRADGCDVILHPEAQISREHARVKREDTGWYVRDDASTNGVIYNGVPLTQQVWHPIRSGGVLELGGQRIFVESARLVAARDLLACLLGWGPDRQIVVDRGLHGLLASFINRTPLVVVGAGTLPAVIRRLYRRALGPDAPFVTHVRGKNLAETLRNARLGTVCVPLRRQSDAIDIAKLLQDMHKTARPQIVLCAERGSLAAAASEALGISQVLTLPALPSNASDLRRLVDAWAVEIAEEWNVSLPPPPISELMKIKGRKPWLKTFGNVDYAVRRYVALAVEGGVTRAAERIGISHPSLTGWFGRKGVPTAKAPRSGSRGAPAHRGGSR